MFLCYYICGEIKLCVFAQVTAKISGMFFLRHR